MVGIYFSGTGNTAYCITKLIQLLDETAEVVPLENASAIEKIKANEVIVLGYPTQFSNAPYVVREFIKSNPSLWNNKQVLCVATMGAFSGDGAGCAARLLRKYGAVILGGLHIKMPDSVSDSKLLKRTIEENREIIKKADQKIADTAEQIKRGRYPKEGISFVSHMIGLFGQRLWFYRKNAGYTDKLKISNACIGCGKCAGLCPMHNISMADGKPHPGSRCTMCYRCISSCPEQAITLLGERVQEQYRFEKYFAAKGM
ncbi:MAG: EFR1 family ferrodoxin [Lachnospiraceae bacterium]